MKSSKSGLNQSHSRSREFNVLSLFDGMSCGRIALDRAGIEYDNYYASEIDKYAIQIAQKNYPDTIQLGDVVDLTTNLPGIGLLIGGSPCQGFSKSGSKLNFKDSRSALFFEFVRILRELKPKYFLLENVKMKKEWQDVITKYLGVSPIEINSSLVSAQNRKRLYWTNIPYSQDPTDKGIMLQDILENDATEPMLSNIYGGFGEKKPRVHYGKSVTLRTPAGGGHIPSVAIATDEMTNKGKAHPLTATYYKTGHSEHQVQHCIDKKQRTMVAVHMKEQVKVRKHEVHIHNLQTCLLYYYKKKNTPIKEIALDLGVKKTKAEHWFRKLGSKYFAIPDPDIWLDLKDYLGIETDEFDKPIMEFEIRDGKFDMADRVYDPKYKAPTMVASSVTKILDDNVSYRKLTPLECERLQTVPEGYTEGVSNTQRYKMLGNGWTIDVIAHLFKGIHSGSLRRKVPVQQKLI